MIASFSNAIDSTTRSSSTFLCAAATFSGVSSFFRHSISHFSTLMMSV